MSLKNVGIAVVLVLFTLAVIAGIFYVGRRSVYSYYDLYSEQKTNRELAEGKVVELASENERLKADLQGGRSADEERESLRKRGQELDRRENLLDEREDKLIAAEADLEEERRDFYQTIGTTREEVGQAKQIKKDYEDTQELLSQTRKERDNWREWFYLLLIFLLVSVLPLLFYTLRLRYLEAKSRKFIEMLEAELSSSSVSVDDVRILTNTFLRLSDADKSQKVLKSSGVSSG